MSVPLAKARKILQKKKNKFDSMRYKYETDKVKLDKITEKIEKTETKIITKLNEKLKD